MEDCVRKGRKSKLTPETRKERREAATKTYYEQNRGRLLEGQKRYREQNRDQERERKRLWYQQNKDRVRDHQKEYREGREPEIRPQKGITIRSLRLPADLCAAIETVRADGAEFAETVIELIRKGLAA